MLVLRRFLVLLLISSLLLPSTAFSSGDRSLTAVLELQGPSVDPDLTGRLADQIREGLATRGPVVSEREMALRLDATAGGSEPLRSVVERARRHYYSLRFEAARSLLDSTLSRVETGELTAEDLPHLISAYVMQGTVYYDQEPRALAAFEEAARLDPTLQLGEAEHSPRTRTLFQRARQRVRGRQGPPAEVEIGSTPSDAELLLDGRRVGRTPSKLELARGRHYLAVKSEGYRDKVRVIEVPSADPIRIQVALEKFEERPVQVSADPQDSLAIGGEAERIGRRLGASRVVFVHVSPLGRRYRAVVQEVDLREKRQITEQGVEFGNGEKRLNRAAEQLIAGLTGSDRPTRVAKPAAPGGKPFWKRPVFWVVGGAILAGGGAGVAIGLGSGGSGDNASVSINTPAPGVTLK